jgi:large conductance mechanosensitive channel
MAMGHNTRQQAMEDGAVILTYGWVISRRLFHKLTKSRAFIDSLVNFIGIGAVLFTIRNLYGYFVKGSIIKYSMKCPFCRKQISSKVRGIASLERKATNETVV